MVGKNKVNINSLFKLPKWLFVILVLCLILRIPSFFEPFSYGDELIYLALGEAIRQNVTLYSNIHDNKPPLLYIIAAIAGNIFWFKAILAVWNVLTIILFWNFVSLLFPKNKNLQKVSVTVFALLTTLPLLEGNIANAEIFMIAPTILAFYILLGKKNTKRNLFFSGICFSMAALFKIPAAFDLPVIFIYWVIVSKNFKQIKDAFYKFFIVSLGFASPIIFSFFWYYVSGGLKDYIIAAFLQNFGYLSSWRPSDSDLSFYAKNRPLIIRGLVLVTGSGIIWLKRRKLSKEFILVSCWLLFSLFAVALSERPYPHYLLQAVPAFSILMGMLCCEKSLMQIYAIIPVSFFFFVPYYYHFWHYPVTSYYYRFLKLSTGRISNEQYISSFGNRVLRNYQIARFVNSHTQTDDRIFVWEDGVAIYAISKRLPPIKYVADYHIKDFSNKQEVINQLSERKPKMIVVLPESSDFPELQLLLERQYSFYVNLENSSIWILQNH